MSYFKMIMEWYDSLTKYGTVVLEEKGSGTGS